MSRIFTKEDAAKMEGNHIVIPDGYTEIVDEAFEKHYSLESITLPAGLEKVGLDAFNDCHKLTKIIVSDDSKYKEKIAVFEEYELRLADDYDDLPTRVLVSFRSKCHKYIFRELSAPLMREILDFVFLPFLAIEYVSLADSIPMTSELYDEMKKLYTKAYNDGIESLKGVQVASHSANADYVIAKAIEIATRAGKMYLGGKESLSNDGYRWNLGNNILNSREWVEEEACEYFTHNKNGKFETSLGYDFIKIVFESMCGGWWHHSRFNDYQRHTGSFPPALFDYLMRGYCQGFPDYKLTVFEQRVDELIELLYYARSHGMGKLKEYDKKVEFLDFAVSEYFKDEYMHDEKNYDEFMSSRWYSPNYKTRKKIRKALEKHCNAAIKKSSTIEEAVLLEMTMEGVIFAIEGENPRVAREHLELMYGVYWNDPMSWNASGNALKQRAEQFRHWGNLARSEGTLVLSEDVCTKETDLFLRFIVQQIGDGMHKDSWYYACEKRINNELRCGKSDDDVRFLKLTAEGFSMLFFGKTGDEIYESLSEKYAPF